MKRFLSLLIIVVQALSCSTDKQNEESLRFIKATLSKDTKYTASLSDTLFHYSIPIMSFSNGNKEQFVYVTNPECSFCIASAISCSNAWVESKSESPFIFLIKSDYTELFEFYMKRDCKKIIPYFSSVECKDLQDGLYTIRNGHVFSYSSWAP